MTARIVVIDSDQFMRKVFTICLNDAGWNVWGYDYSHIDLWPSVKQHKPDLIILNFTRQNGGAGWQFLQMIKMDDATAQIPILVTTTVFPLAVEMRSYLLARYIQIVYQPFDVSTFIRLIQRTLMQASQGHVLFSGDRTFPVLVVEDNQDLQEGLETVLMLEGFQVATANNGLLALEAVYTAEHCLIFLDIQMPIMGGIEFLTIYKEQLRPHSPVVVLSAEPDIEKEVFPPFVVDVLSKPFELSRIVKLAEKYTQAV